MDTLHHNYHDFILQRLINRENVPKKLKSFRLFSGTNYRMDTLVKNNCD